MDGGNIMFGWCKPRREFFSRLIDGQCYQFNVNDICFFEDFGDLYNVFSGCYDVDFTKENFYKKFKVIHRETGCFEQDCIIDIYTYKKINSTKTESYLADSIYLEEYYKWLNILYDFKKEAAFQELIDFEDDEREIDSEISKKLYRDFKRYHNEAKLYNEQPENKDSFIQMYESMMNAFKFASDNGKVIFI